VVGMMSSFDLPLNYSGEDNRMVQTTG